MSLTPRLRRAARVPYLISTTYGIDPRRMFAAIRDTPRYFRDLWRFRALARTHDDLPSIARLLPILDDRRGAAGTAYGHYFFQDLWAARKIFRRHPTRHVDIGSRIDGFVAHLLVFMPVDVIDIRALPSAVDGLTFVQGDATRLVAVPDQSIASLSSLHAVEHFGLGRYGDPLDATASFEAMRTLARVLAPGGRLYFSVPIGRERIEFNAHRILSPQRVLREFGDLELVSFAAVDDSGAYVENADPGAFADSVFACGLFEFTRAEQARG